MRVDGIRSPLDPGVTARTATRTDPSARQRQWMGILGNDNGGPRDDTLAFYFVMLKAQDKTDQLGLDGYVRRSICSPLDPGVTARTATRTDPSARQRQWMGILGNDNGGPRDDTLAFYFVMLKAQDYTLQMRVDGCSPLDPGVAARTATRTDPSARQRQWMGIGGNDNGGPRDDNARFLFLSC